MVSTKLNIGKIPISKGEYQEGTAYQRLNQVTMLGSTYQSKIDDNTSAPAQMGADGAVENINTDKWLCIAVGNVSAARKVVYNNDTSGLEAGNVQEAIDEVGSKVGDLSNRFINFLVFKNPKNITDVTEDFMDNTVIQNEEITTNAGFTVFHTLKVDNTNGAKTIYLYANFEVYGTATFGGFKNILIVDSQNNIRKADILLGKIVLPYQ